MASRSLTHEIRATIVRIAAYMGGLALLAAAAASFLRAPQVVAAIDAAPRPQWVKVDNPHPAFELVMPELAASPSAYTILRRTADGARKDVLSWGEAAGGGPYINVEIYRPAAAGERFLDAPSEIAARILAFTVTDDVKPAGRLDSKFGPIPLVDFAIATGGHQRRCLGFARPFDQPPMQIAGWYCSPHSEIVERAALGCLLDRLTILSAGGDSRLDALFARAEVSRSFCGRRNPILAATPEHEQAVPAAHRTYPRHIGLRGRLGAR